MPPTERVIVERHILDSEVTTRIPETLTLKLLECGPALSDIWKIHNGIGVILRISGTVDGHLRSAKLSEDGLQTLAIVDDRHPLTDGSTSCIQNDGVVEVENQDARGPQYAVSVRDVRFLASVPMRTASDIRRIQVRSI